MADPITLDDIYGLFRASQAEADRRSAEADQRLQQLEQLQTRLSQEADRRLARLERIAANTSREVAGLTSRWGQFVENLVEPAVVRLFQERGIAVQETYRRMKSNRPGTAMEIDIFAVDGSVAVAIEVKARLSQRDVDDFLAKLERFKQAFPNQASYQLYGAVAGIEIDAGVDRYAYQQGLFVIKQTGDTVAIANDAAFRPAAW